MKTKPLLVLLSLAALVGCSSPPKRIEPGGPTSLTTFGVDIADFKAAASYVVESLLKSDVFDRFQGRKARILVSTIKNDTSQHFDTDQITFKITTDLLNSGKAETETLGGKSVDSEGRAIVAERDFANDSKSPERKVADFTLAGKILQTRAREGNMREVSYTLQLYLNDPKTGSAVWQGEKIVTKQGKRASVSF
ncbi:MAG TPA: hypothetical protein VNM37_21720 [Candidatus Dormibacteraeota bacterium]|jgi:uncharacterized protein (TIGR02722 family)|nr:hypothetical protein [Candidatus Dormibacteraeota bacterium]